MKIKTGDRVIVIAGKDKGKTGKVLQTFPRQDKVVVEGLHMMTKYMRRQRRSDKGQKVTFAAPMHVSNVMLVDAKTQKPTRIRMKIEGGKKVRIAVRSGEAIS